MLTPDYLETLPDALVELWQQVEDDILRDIARRIGKMPDRDALTDTAAWQSWRYEQMQACHQDVLSLLSKYSGKSKAEIRRLLLDAGLATLASDDALYQAMGFAPSAIDTNQALNNLLNAGYRQTLGTWQNLTATTANTVTGEFERALDRAWLQVASGAFDYKTAVKRAVDGLADHMAGVTYPSGHKDTLEVAVRRAVLTGVNQTCAKLQLARADEMGCAFVEVTAHAGARPEHAVWQGKIYHRGGAIVYKGVRYEDFETATGYGTGPGLCGWNCRHNFYPYFPGLSVPNYTADRLAELNARDIEYNGQKYTRYEITQMQRALERQVRKYKRRYLAEDAAGADTAATAVRLKQARQDLSAFTKSTGSRNDSARTSVSGFGRRQASKATAVARKEIEKYSVYHYNKDGTVFVTDDRTQAAHPRINAAYKPFAVVDTLSQNGKQHDRTFYDSEGRMTRQISNGPHGNPKKHPFGQHGEHVHDILWKNGVIVDRPVRELTDKERKENADIL